MAFAAAKMIVAGEIECDLFNHNKPITIITALGRIVAYRDLLERSFINAHKTLLRIKNKTNPTAPGTPSARPRLSYP